MGGRGEEVKNLRLSPFSLLNNCPGAFILKRFKFRHALYRRSVDAHYMKLNMPRHIHTDAGGNLWLVSGELSYPIENQIKLKMEETGDPVHRVQNIT